ncbi:ER degradation-enhancing alpha-mannosidase-like protein 2 [Eurytemora carolleeae]|uniref:ER degradation-enhancing alpha-mannosidase-like protein 2 n=1 Tax=Eurytemora carolleeae TaxID=1294199 RepID=UPI000C759923|nr:ER degradation-enhancing alpha-mannosidase-like protein 2 [Eurytemora carolleeae]|eukprot:XP_023336094.1 ER degradation-enhancing alpha-mannosidase-like protein 2 [Eurytemora affinis]
MRVVFLTLCICETWLLSSGGKFNQYDRTKLHKYREEVRSMFTHAYDSYLIHAYPYDELRPLSCDGVDTWGSYSLTLIDALDTLAVMGNFTEFARVYNLVSQRENFDANINVSVFETNIRIVGGLLSAHLMAKRAGVYLEEGWPCSGPLLRLAEDAADRLLPAFDTPTGMPYGTVNLRTGVPEGETPITCTAGVGTYIVEFGTLSRLTGNPIYEDTALRALRALWYSRSNIGLLGNHIDVLTGKWTAVEAGIGAGVDSYFEYLVKASSLLNRPELLIMFNQGREAVDQYLRKDDWYFWVNMKNGQVTLPLFQNLEAFWPGMLSLVGDLEPALKSLHNYHQVWKQYGFTPEFYNVAQGGVSANREGYPLRPELIESIMYLYRATGDPWLVDAGVDILKSIQYSAYTPCGYATVKNVRTHTLENRMESFFLAETVKYLYLLFDPDNFIHNSGTTATVHETPHGKCILDAGGYVFNSEAHPMDPAALACCSAFSETEMKNEISGHLVDILDPASIRSFRGDLVPQRIKEIERRRKENLQEKEKRNRLIREELEKIRSKAQKDAAALKKQQDEQQDEKQDDLKEQQDELDEKEVDLNEQQGSDSPEELELEELEIKEEIVDSKQKEEQVTDTEPSVEIVDNEIAGEIIKIKDQTVKTEEINFEEDPQFSETKESDTKDLDESGKVVKNMIQKLSSGEFLQSQGIVQPEQMPSLSIGPANQLVEAINSLVERFLPTRSREFDLIKFSDKIKNENQYR